jgi:hypothetical protein
MEWMLSLLSTLLEGDEDELIQQTDFIDIASYPHSPSMEYGTLMSSFPPSNGDDCHL